MSFFFRRNDTADHGGHGHHRRRRRRGDQRLSLADLDHGGKFRIVAVEATGEIRRRLLDMGFVRGATGTVLREALLKDPLELELMGYRISLRRAEAGKIIIEGLD